MVAEDLTHVGFADSSGAAHAALLCIPTAAEIYPLIYEPMYRDAELAAHLLPLEMAYLVETIDDTPVSFERMQALFTDDAVAFRTLLATRNRLYETVASEGRIRFGCPHCPEGTASFDLLSLTFALNAPPWPITDRNRIFLEYPALASDLQPGRRPQGVPTAAHIGVETPSAALGLVSPILTGTLHTIVQGEEERARELWEVPFTDPPPGREMWTYERPGFQAALRLCLALRQPGSNLDEGMTPEIFEKMPVPDFFFLDNIYYLTHYVDVEDAERVRCTCGACGGMFLPVL
ncbi:MAG TPA: hypothetical protein VHI13_17100 [Candidatus Kapabacteria bacterium]|nr:hypothetical protein [Candidatus Kapabacteria bacterium]